MPVGRWWNAGFLLLGFVSVGVAIFFSIHQSEQTEESNGMFARSNELALLSQMQDRQDAADAVLFSPQVRTYVSAGRKIPPSSPLGQQVKNAADKVNLNAYLIRHAFSPVGEAHNYFFGSVVCAFRRIKTVFPTKNFTAGWNSGRTLLGQGSKVTCLLPI
jgi:hypothetical protein